MDGSTADTGGESLFDSWLELNYVANQLDARPAVDSAVEYSVGQSDGVNVTFGDHDAPGPAVEFNRSSAFSAPQGDASTRGSATVKALGTEAVGDGTRVVDGQLSTVVDVGSTPEVRGVQQGLERNDSLQRFEDRLGALPGEFALHTDRPLLLRDPSTARDAFVFRVPLTKNGEFHLFLQAHGTTPETATVKLDRAPGHDHIACAFGICVDCCAVLCSTLAGLSGAFCLATCAGTIAGIPIAPACGAICAGVVGGICYPTCKNQVH